ncbi:hypothetical protein MNBD_GAMMA10-3346 [hydrothermal vent metagenome]|uniref:Uncharacterized protein n=1 Tax=hydrothermal vent metagenome TaxID=652676 RepID=A0A3B0X171_9ZZZZ
MCIWEHDWRNKKGSEWPVLREIFYIVRRAPRGAIYGVAHSPNGLVAAHENTQYSHKLSALSRGQLINIGLSSINRSNLKIKPLSI